MSPPVGGRVSPWVVLVYAACLLVSVSAPSLWVLAVPMVAWCAWDYAKHRRAT